MFFKYPYTNLYNLNLDWIIQAIKEMQSIVEPLDRVVNSVNGMTGDVEITKALLTQILGGLVETFNGRSGAVELTAEDVNATLIDIVWTSDPGETVHDLTQAQIDEMYASGKRILIFVNNLGVADQVYFLQWYDNHAQPQEYTPTSALAGVVSFNGMTGNVVATGDDIATSATDSDTIAESLAEKVPVTRAVNGQPLSSNVNLDADDIPSAAISGATTVEMALGNLNASKVPNARTVNGKQLLNDIVLDDADIPSSVDGKTDVEEVLEYHSEEIAALDDEMTDKADIIISEASGAVASFEDGADGLPVRGLTVAIQPVQAGTGDPSPDNVRPITGWTGAKVTRTGKNLLSYTPNKLIGSSISIPLDETRATLLKGGQTYKLSFAMQNATTWRVCALVYDVYGDRIFKQEAFFGNNSALYPNSSGMYYIWSDNYSNTADSLTPEMDCYVMLYWLLGDTTNETTMVNPQLELGTTATAYEPYQGRTYDITFPSEAGTAYSGNLTVNGDGTGTLTVDTRLVDLGTQNFKKNDSSLIGVPCFYCDLSECKTNSALIACSSYIIKQTRNDITGTGQIAKANADTTLCVIRDDRYAEADAATFKTAVSGIQLVYELETPITYTLTPTEITTLLGINNVWADTGNVSVSYRADTKTYVNQRVEDVESEIDAVKAATAYVEEGNTATQKSYTAGEFILWKGALYTVNSGGIPVNTAITGHVTAVTGGGLNALNTAVGMCPRMKTFVITQAQGITTETTEIAFTPPTGVTNDDVKLLLLYTEYDNVFFQWRPQSSDHRMNLATTWAFNVINRRGSTVGISPFYATVLY